MRSPVIHGIVGTNAVIGVYDEASNVNGDEEGSA
jgi:hypothetical protein